MTLLLWLESLIEPLPGGIHINWGVGLTVATAALGLYNQAVGLACIFITVDDVVDFLLGVCLGMVEHFQQLADVFVDRCHGRCRFNGC